MVPSVAAKNDTVPPMQKPTARDVAAREAQRGEEVGRGVEVVREALLGQVRHEGHRSTAKSS